jgi:hypothetical protein
VRLRLAFPNQLLAYANWKRQIGEPAAVEMTEFAPANPELAAAKAMRCDRDVRPAADLLSDSISDALHNRSHVFQRLSYGALIKVGTRSGRITIWVPITEIV